MKDAGENIQRNPFASEYFSPMYSQPNIFGRIAVTAKLLGTTSRIFIVMIFYATTYLVRSSVKTDPSNRGVFVVLGITLGFGRLKKIVTLIF